MDPNAALETLRRSIKAVYDALDGNGDLIDEANTLAGAAEALDGWLSRGGFKPAAWDRSNL